MGLLGREDLYVLSEHGKGLSVSKGLQGIERFRISD